MTNSPSPSSANSEKSWWDKFSIGEQAGIIIGCILGVLVLIHMLLYVVL